MKSEKSDINETQLAIQTEFMRQYSINEYSRITIKELCAEVPVARTTFYSYYQNLDELKQEIEDTLIEGIKKIARDVSSGDMQSMDFSIFFDLTLQYIKKHWSYFYFFLIRQPNMQFIYKWKNAIKYHFKLRYYDKAGITNYELILEVITSSVIGAYSYWLMNPEKVDTIRLNQLVIASLESMNKIL